jgi:hypothetical protein
MMLSIPREAEAFPIDVRSTNGQRIDGPLLKRIAGLKRGFESRRSRSYLAP